ncbi:MAG: hypothetical protein K2I61_05215, partial [Muribaculaceae bacterium]|nr:hypothetical protein [Muribaculaceae bacterium]
MAADRPITSGEYARREILKESFIDVDLNVVVYIKDSFRISRLISAPRVAAWSPARDSTAPTRGKWVIKNQEYTKD